jgi:hypothetical protein
VGTGLPARVETRNRDSTLAGAYSYERPVIQGIGANGMGQIDLVGTGFGPSPLVTIDDVPATVLMAVGDTLQVEIPDGISGRAGVVVTAGGQNSDAAFIELGASGCADLNGDGVVDASDLAALIAAWGPCP